MDNPLLQTRTAKGIFSITKADNQGKLDAFLNDVWSQTYENPFANRERIWQDKAGFFFQIFDGAILLKSIRTFEQGKGYGSEALDWVCKLADKHNVVLHLTPQRVGKEGLRTSDLRNWYTRHDFRRTKDYPGSMRREPHGDFHT